jgi:type III secretion system FlhB-like substrate exporter
MKRFWNAKTGRRTRCCGSARQRSAQTGAAASPRDGTRGHGGRDHAYIAEENGIPLYEEPALVEALARLHVSEYIPRELYAIVAEVLAYVYRLDLEQRSRPPG